jgi:hypothetical protein
MPERGELFMLGRSKRVERRVDAGDSNVRAKQATKLLKDSADLFQILELG